ncbi:MULTISPECIES: type VII toxin-antitoxin system HepT family RNase toxin [unclassified Luteococcus]|uniref:type VII toxin-antitoxin system HepT family RNase toxin n=1 Tax=unclassified Luteococcus TaxID=2639923 RepID=UPI00313C0DED
MVLQKLTQMARLLDTLDGIGPVGRQRLDADPILRLALERVVTQLVDLAIDVNMHVVTTAGHGSVVPADGKESFAAAARAGLLAEPLANQLALNVGLRNVVVHDYLALDEDIFLAGVELAGVQYRAYVRQVSAWIQRA